MKSIILLLIPLAAMLGIDLFTPPSKKKYILLLAVATILFIVWSALFFGINTMRANRPLAAEAMISMLSDALTSYHKDIGQYPNSNEGLSALINRPSSIDKAIWKGPYMRKNIPSDPWGHAFIYVPIKTNEYRLYSYGSDGISKSNGNDPDDINNWDTTKSWRAFYETESMKEKSIYQIYKGIVLALYPLMILCLFIRLYRYEKYNKGVHTDAG